MATWHQDRAPVKRWHPTKWTIWISPPGRSDSAMRWDTQKEAQDAMEKLGPDESKYAILYPPHAD
jgi:hypothetical protein